MIIDREEDVHNEGIGIRDGTIWNNARRNAHPWLGYSITLLNFRNFNNKQGKQGREILLGIWLFFTKNSFYLMY